MNAAPPFRWRLWLMAGIVFLVGTMLRFDRYDGDHSHPDEPITTGVLQRMRKSGDWDTNWAKAELPEEYRYNQYNFSSYFRGLYFYYRLVKVIPGTEGFRGQQEGFLLYRSFSVWCATGALFIALWLGWRIGGAGVGLLTGTITAFAPLLVQDAHYARPEAFCTLLFMIVVACLCGKTRHGPGLSTIVGAAFVLGALIACKISFAIVAWMPWVPLLIRGSGNDLGRDTSSMTGVQRSAGIYGHRLGLLSLPLLAMTAGFAVGVPGVFSNPEAYLNGLQVLSRQYAGVHPPHGHLSGNPVADLLFAYLGATLGWATLAAMTLGVLQLVKDRAWSKIALLALPALLTLGYFSTRSVFFERNFSHVIPLLALLAAIGVCSGLEWCAKHGLGRWQLVLIGAFFVIAVLVRPVSVTARLMLLAFSGKEVAARGAFEESLLSAHPGGRLLERTFFFEEDADRFANQVSESRKEHKGPILLRHESWDDDWTKPFDARLRARFDVEQLATRPSLFSDIPICTLHTYLSARHDYYRIGEAKSVREPHLSTGNER